MIRIFTNSIFSIIVLIMFCNKIFAQEETLNPIDTLAAHNMKMQSEIDLLKKIKITGYIHAQYQIADTAGSINSYAGGTFSKDVDNRFIIRRSRLKIVWDKQDEEKNVLGQAVFQIDFSQNGVALRDAYLLVLDPWTKWIGIRMGAFDKVFGYELIYSSSSRETPERGRMSQILFPGEKDLGAEIFIQPTKNSKYNFFKVQAAIYNGVGVLNNDFDNKKDFITRLSFFKDNKNESIRYTGGISYFNGGHKYGNKFNYELSDNSVGIPKWNIVDSLSTNINKITKQQYYGLDCQVSCQSKIGFTTLRAEYVSGNQGGTPSSSSTPRTLSTESMYMRKFNGAYFYLIQNILSSKHNIVLKYDWYDPNTKVKESQIGETSSNLTSTDIKFSTLGLGYYYNLTENCRFFIYKDFVKNNNTKLAGYLTDAKDNKLTIRIQYRFF